MVEVRFANAAEEDLVDIDAFSVARFGTQVASDYMHGFTEAFVRLAEFPFAGRAMPDLGKGMRCLIHREHKLLYRVEKRSVLIIRVMHHAMDVRRAFRGH